MRPDTRIIPSSPAAPAWVVDEAIRILRDHDQNVRDEFIASPWVGLHLKDEYPQKP